ncbi:MAG: phenylacetate--CoA ligase family protein [Azonexaceae bacterium]|nr:phenylacetate--CoA ligase family protein [Azonexaceae bacterium]
MQKVVRFAANNVPYYREAFAKAGFVPDQLASLEDVKLIPFLTKRDAFSAGDQMLAQNFKGPRFENSTSGTTGMSMRVVRDLHSINRESAFNWRQSIWAGAKHGDRRVWIRGDQIVPSKVTNPPFWRFSRADNTLMMSAYHLSEQSAESYIRALEEFDPVFGMAYPSPVLLLARYMISAGRKYRGKSLRGFVTSSETVTGEHRKLVEEAFGCQIFDQYCSAERVTFIGTCEHGNYHVNSDYGYTELIPQGDGTCEVVGTSFDNFLMPWIRYRLGDSVVPADPNYVCPCGRSFPVVESIVGRVEDYVLMPDGRHVFMMSNMLDAIPNLLEGQVRQESPDEVTILVVPVPGKPFDDEDTVARAREQLGDGLRISVKHVESVPRTSNGKLRVVVRAF